MTKKLRAIVLSCITILVCVATMAVGTFALFTDTINVHNHLQAGSLSAKLERTLLKSKVGGVVRADNNTLVDFTETDTATENFFEISDSDYIVPTDYFEATVKLTNTSDIAFMYTIKFVLNGTVVNNQTPAENAALVSQLKLIVDGTEVTSGAVAASELANGASKTIVVRVEFKNYIGENGDPQNNNDAQGGEVDFDIIFECVQKV